MAGFTKVFLTHSALFLTFYLGVVLENGNVENLFAALIWIMIIMFTLSLFFSGTEKFKEEVAKDNNSEAIRTVSHFLSVILSVLMVYYGYIVSGILFLFVFAVLRGVINEIRRSAPNQPT